MAMAEAADGARLHFDIAGTGPVHILLTHSLAMDGRFWAPVTEALGRRAQVATWDCRGHGASDKPAGPYTTDQFADDLLAVVNAAGWESAIIAGASMGGTVSLAFAIRHPSRVEALGLFDTTASYGDEAPTEWAERAAIAQSKGLASLTDFQQTRWFSDAFRKAHPCVVRESIETFCRNDPAAYAETCHMLGSADLRSGLPKLSVPTSIIVGEEDYATPIAMAQDLHRGIRGSTMEVIPGARHLTPLECPGLIAERLIALAEKVES
jgi:3-oxoadipate enol-lactonase